MDRSRIALHRELGCAIAALFALSIFSGGCGPRRYPTHEPTIFTTSDAGGSLEVSGIFNQCPEATLDVSPATARPDQPFTVSGGVSDPDGDAGVLTWMFGAASGTFADPAAHQTTYSCAAPGPVAITLTVSDGSCEIVKTVSVFCLGVHPDGGASDAASGGAGGSGAGGRGGAGGGGTGSGGASGTGGAGAVNNCPAAEPTSGDGTTCAPCTTDNCSLAASPAGTDGCCGLASAADQALCLAAVACFARSACTVSGDANRCFCGNSAAACFAAKGAANGPCAASVIAAAKTSDPAAIKSLFTSPASPLGRAVNLLGCWGSFCSAECAIPWALVRGLSDALGLAVTARNTADGGVSFAVS